MNPVDIMKVFNWNPIAKGFPNRTVKLYKAGKIGL